MSMLGSKGGKQTQQQKDAYAGQTNLFNTQAGALNQAIGTAGSVTPQAQGFLNQSSSTFQPAIDYWSKLASGDPATMAAAAAPTMLATGKQYQAARDSASTSMPQGGYRSTALANLPFQEAAQNNTYLQQLQPQAASNLANIGSSTGALGSGLFGSVLGALSGAGSGASGTGASLLNTNLLSNQQGMQQGQALGQGIAAIVPAIMKLFGK